MRISQSIRFFLKEQAVIVSKNAKIFLFGSRIDDQKKGGDIDILILSEERIPSKFLRKIRIEFYKKFGIQKLDLINFTFDEENSFKNLILDEAVEL